MEVTSGSDSRSSDDSSNFFIQEQPAFPSVIVIGGGIAGIAAARSLHENAFKVVVLESRNRIGGRIRTEYSFGFPVDMGAGWLHGVCNENPLAPLIRKLGLQLYRTSGDDSVLYDHDLESCALFDMDGHPVPQGVAKEVENLFKWILKETQKIRDENAQDMSILQAVSLVLQRSPNLRPNGVAYKVLQWYICRMEAWFATDADKISLKCWDQEHVLTGGHGLMVQGFHPIIKNLAEGVDIKLNHRVTKIARKHDRVVVTVDGCHEFSADAAIVTIPVGVLQARLVEFEPPLPEWKESAIQDMGIGNENKVALLFEKVFWPDVELLGVVADTSYDCSYFLNLHKATGHPVLVYMAAGRCAIDLEKMSDKDAADFVALQLKKMFPTTATDPIKYLVSHWWSERDSLGCYSCDLVGKPDDLSAKIQKPIGNLFFAGEATSVDHSGSVHGAFSTGILAAELCKNHLLSSTYHHYFQSSSHVCNNRARMEEEVNNAPHLQISRL